MEGVCEVAARIWKKIISYVVFGDCIINRIMNCVDELDKTTFIVFERTLQSQSHSSLKDKPAVYGCCSGDMAVCVRNVRVCSTSN